MLDLLFASQHRVPLNLSVDEIMRLTLINILNVSWYNTNVYSS